MLHLPDYFLTRFGRRFSFFYSTPASKRLITRAFFCFLGIGLFVLLSQINIWRALKRGSENLDLGGINTILDYTSGSILHNCFYGSFLANLLIQYSSTFFGIDLQFSTSQLHQKFFRKGVQVLVNVGVVIYSACTMKLDTNETHNPYLVRFVNFLVLITGSLFVTIIDDLFQNKGFLNLMSVIMGFVYFDTLLRSFAISERSFLRNTYHRFIGSVTLIDYLFVVPNNFVAFVTTAIVFYLYIYLEFRFYNFSLKSSRVRGAYKNFPLDFFIASTTPIFVFSMALNFFTSTLAWISSSDWISFFNHIYHKNPVTGELTGFLSAFVPISTPSIGRAMYWLTTNPFNFIIRFINSTIVIWVALRLLVRNFKTIIGMSIESFIDLLRERSLFIPEFQERSPALIKRNIENFFKVIEFRNTLFFSILSVLTYLTGTLGNVQIIGLAILFNTIKSFLQQASRDLPDFPQQ